MIAVIPPLLLFADGQSARNIARVNNELCIVAPATPLATSTAAAC